VRGLHKRAGAPTVARDAGTLICPSPPIPPGWDEEVRVKRPILNRSRNGAPEKDDALAGNLQTAGPGKRAGRLKPAARAAVAGGEGSGIPGLIEQPRAVISLPSSKSPASGVTAPLQTGTLAPAGTARRR
jgi:hypothetical protein